MLLYPADDANKRADKAEQVTKNEIKPRRNIVEPINKDSPKPEVFELPAKLAQDFHDLEDAVMHVSAATRQLNAPWVLYTNG